MSSSAGTSATFSFVGTSATWIGLRGPQTGIARVFLDGAFQAEVDTYSPAEIQAGIYTASSLAPGRHTLRIEATGLKNARATDSAVAVDAFDAGSRFEDTNAAIVYSGVWSKEVAARPFSGTSANTGAGTAALASASGARATFTFTGTAVTWIGFRWASGGIARVSIDGTPAGEVDTFAASAEQLRVPLFNASGLSNSTHTLTIEATGLKHANSSGTWVVIDGFDVALPSSLPAIARLQEGHASILYTAQSEWVLGNEFNFASGEFAMGSATAGAKATLTFSGTSARWIGIRGFSTGLARVSIDGAFVGQIDTRAGVQEEFQAPVFAVTGLTPGSHTLTIEVVGRNGEPAGAPVDPVWVDAFDIY
jgi:hypothetical protein